MTTIIDAIRDQQSAERESAAVQYAEALCDPARMTPDGIGKLRAAAGVLNRSLQQMNDDLGRIGDILAAAELARTESAALAEWQAAKADVRASLSRVERMQSDLLLEREQHERVIGRSRAAAVAHGRARDAARMSASHVHAFWLGLGFSEIPAGAPPKLKL